MARTNWTQLIRNLNATVEESGFPAGRRITWKNPRHSAIRRYEKLPYVVHYANQEEECRNVVLGRQGCFLVFTQQIYIFDGHPISFP